MESDDTQQQALELCEAVLFGGLQRQLEASVQVGAQLSKIRDNELYRVARCETFAAYCRRFLELTRDQAGRFLEITVVVDTIRAARLELPANETQAFMLSKIPRERLTSFWRTVLELCAREEITLSDAVVRRAIRFEIASEKQMSSSEGVTAERAGVQVTLEC